MIVVENNEIDYWLWTSWDNTLEWDNANREKLKKHNLTMEDIESLFDFEFFFGGELVPANGQKWNERRFIIFGTTKSKRALVIIWTIRGKKIRPICCRSMRTNERKTYIKKTKGFRRTTRGMA